MFLPIFFHFQSSTLNQEPPIFVATIYALLPVLPNAYEQCYLRGMCHPKRLSWFCLLDMWGTA